MWTIPVSQIGTKKPQPVLRLGLEKESAVGVADMLEVTLASLAVMFHFVAVSGTL